MTHFVIPVVVLFIIFYGLIKEVEIYDVFLEGVKEGLSIALKIFPTMFAMVMSVDVLIKSKALNDLIILIEPVLGMLKFPKELVPLAVMRPISGGSALVLMNNVLANYGPDSTLGRIASVIQGSSDTTVYIISLYYSSIGIKKIKYSLIVGLLADLCGAVLAVIVVNIMF